MNNISFKGYSNIVAAKNVKVGNLYTSYIGVKLDDNDEYKDLSSLKKIHELQGVQGSFNNNDILTLTHIADENSKYEYMYLGSKSVWWGEQLKIIKDEYVPEYISQKSYKKIEEIHLKVYTLLASLTKRMSFDKFENEDENYKRVLECLNINLKNMRIGEFLLFNQNEAFELLSIGCLKHTKFQNVAKGFNKVLSLSMTNFFK